MGIEEVDFNHKFSAFMLGDIRLQRARLVPVLRLIMKETLTPIAAKTLLGLYSTNERREETSASSN